MTDLLDTYLPEPAPLTDWTVVLVYADMHAKPGETAVQTVLDATDALHALVKARAQVIEQCEEGGYDVPKPETLEPVLVLRGVHHTALDYRTLYTTQTKARLARMTKLELREMLADHLP